MIEENKSKKVSLIGLPPNVIQDELVMFQNMIAIYKILSYNVYNVTDDASKVIYKDLEERRQGLVSYFSRSLDDIIKDFTNVVIKSENKRY